MTVDEILKLNSETMDEGGAVLDLANAAYDNACATHGQRNEGTEAFWQCFLSSAEDLLTRAEPVVAQWYRSHGVEG